MPDADAAVVPARVGPASLPCVRSLGRRGVRTVVASEHARLPEFSSRYCDEAVRVPSPDADLAGYRDALLDLAARPDVATVVPVREIDAYLLSRDRAAFEEHVSLVVPSFEVLERVHDRLALFEIARDVGVPVPETRRLDAVADWRDGGLVKARYNLLAPEYVDGYPADAVTEVADLVHVSPGDTPDVDAIVERMGHVPIAQEYVDKRAEYMVGAVCDHGQPLATVQLRQDRCDSWRGGGGAYRTSVHEPELADAARRLFGALDWHGLACVEYMQEATTGEFVLTEVNPRLWQSLAPSIAAGVDVPYYYWLAATGRADEIDPQPRLGVASHLLYGELGYLQSVRSEASPFAEPPGLAGALWDVISSCVRTPRFDYLALDDPLPFVEGLRRVARGATGRRPDPP